MERTLWDWLDESSVLSNARKFARRAVPADGDIDLPVAQRRLVNVPTGDMVYMIWMPGAAFKIGISKDPLRRLDGLQVGNPAPLYLVASVPAGDRSADVERWFHQTLEPWNTSGEWFAANVDPTRAAVTVLFILSTVWRHCGRRSAYFKSIKSLERRSKRGQA